ncbi:MAG: transpeptidase family protein [Acidobacteria bacterium]|nr:transpeptidase family protein [Acidobacteriota bacterium]
MAQHYIPHLSAKTGVRKIVATRIVLVIAVVVVWILSIVFRLVQLQVLEHDRFEQIARDRQEITRAAAVPRGLIYDCRMHELARNMGVSMVVAEPRRIRDLASAATGLAAALELDPAQLKARMANPERRAYLVVKHRIDPKAEARVEELRINGVYLVDESMRVYPNRNLASHVLGFVNMNGDGGAGLEELYDKDLRGTEGIVALDIDANGRSFRGRVIRPPRQGHSLVLSLDRSIQYIAERELAAAVAEHRAKAGTVLVMETDTGRILALANWPDFNCNIYNTYPADLWRNRAITDLFEPGSTFKVVVAAAALETRLTHPAEVIDCQNGSIRIGRHVFHDHRPYGLLTFQQVIENSSNVGAAKLGLRLGEERLHNALRRFGFGAETGIDLPGEIIGLVRDWRSWSGLSIGAISFGQEIGVTSIQMLTAINVIASGGYRVRPYVVDRVIDADGNLLRTTWPEKTRIVSPQTAAAVSSAFEGVITKGTGRDAALEGYRAAGKTGTAQKIVNGRYSDTDYLASFVGYAPLPNPRISVLVQIDSPRNGDIYGGKVAAPVFKRIAQQVLLYLRVHPDMTLPLPKRTPAQLAAASKDLIRNATPVPPIAASGQEGAAVEAGSEIVFRLPGRSVAVPDFRGMSKRKVLARCHELGIVLQPNGSGVAVFQSPPAGKEMSIGETCNVTFATSTAGASLRSCVDANTQLAQSAVRVTAAPSSP